MRATVDAPTPSPPPAVVDAAAASGWLDADAAPFCFGLDFVRDAAAPSSCSSATRGRPTAPRCSPPTRAAAALDVLRDAATDAAASSPPPAPSAAPGRVRTTIPAAAAIAHGVGRRGDGAAAAAEALRAFARVVHASRDDVWRGDDPWPLARLVQRAARWRRAAARR